MTPKKERILNYTKSRLSRFTGRATYEQLREFTQEALTQAKIMGSQENLSDVDFQVMFNEAYPRHEINGRDPLLVDPSTRPVTQSTQPFSAAASYPKKVGETTADCGDLIELIGRAR